MEPKLDVLTGHIQLFPFNFVPSGWISCEGQTLNVSSYEALYSLIGNRFGGDGTTTFVLPNLKNARPMVQPSPYKYPMLYCIAYTGVYPSRS